MLKEQLHKKFICTNGENCEIASANRTNCKFCRFAKCLRVGMTLEGLYVSVLICCQTFIVSCTLLYHRGNFVKSYAVLQFFCCWKYCKISNKVVVYFPWQLKRVAAVSCDMKLITVSCC